MTDRLVAVNINIRCITNNKNQYYFAARICYTESVNLSVSLLKVQARCFNLPNFSQISHNPQFHGFDVTHIPSRKDEQYICSPSIK